MYLYFDSQGVLKEIINDIPLRQDSSGINKIYVYLENYNITNTGKISYITSDDVESIAYTHDHIYNSSATPIPNECYIPYDAKRDLKFFKYYTPYTFFEFDIPTTILQVSGATVGRIAFYSSSTLVLALQLVPFMIEGTSREILPNESITVAQYNYLLKKVGDCVLKAGDTMTGALNMSYQPINNIGNLYANYLRVYGNGEFSGDVKPASNNDRDLGATNYKWRDLYLSGNLKDGTNSKSVANLLVKGDVKNNLTSTDTDKPLSANQGKVLDDKITVIKNDNYLISGASKNYPQIVASGDNVVLKELYKDKDTTLATEKSINIPLADDNTAGLMSYTDYLQIRDNTTRIQALEGQTVRLLYSVKTNPTAQEIEAFVIGKGYPQTQWASIGVVVAGTFHIWHYYGSTDGWRDDGTDTVSQFTNSTAGVIKGSTTDGRVYAENDGTGSVYGWDTLKGRVSAVELGLASLPDITATDVEIEEGE